MSPGYNVQIEVDSEYIVAGFRYPNVTADSGYESEQAYTYLREQKHTGAKAL